MTPLPVRRKLLLVALALSAVLHAVLIAGVPVWRPFAPQPVAEPTPLQARLLPPAVEPPSVPAPRVAAPPARRAAPPKRAPRARPAPVEAPAVSAAASSPPVHAEEPDPVPVGAAEGDVGEGGDAGTGIGGAPMASGESPSPAVEPVPQEEPSGAPAEYPLRSVRLVYDLLHGDSQTRIGKVTHSFETDGERYAADAVGEAVGFVSLFYGGKFVQRSRGVIGPEGLVPEEYTLDRGRGDPPERAVFNWPLGQVELSWRNERRTVALPKGAQDPLSALHQIYFMQPMAPLSRLRVATGRKLGDYTYEVLGEADLITPLGLVRTLHVGRVASDGSALEVWLDRDRELLPARIYSRDRKGTILDQVVREVALLQ